MEDRLQYGVFIGYSLAPGDKWSGQYLVCDLDDFVDVDLNADAEHKDIAIKLHYTEIVKMCTEGIHFPLKKKYGRQKFTLEGKEETWSLTRNTSNASA